MKFEEWLAQQDGVIEVDCGCVTAEAFYHWMRVAYEAGNELGKWTPVAERMPETGQEVLCIDQFGDYETAYYSTGYMSGLPFFATAVGEFHPTHWMPLPAGPKEQDNV